MQRWFSTFPSGPPALGLLILRLVLAVLVSFDSIEYVAAWAASAPATKQTALILILVAALACSAMVAIGLLTPVVQILVSLFALGVLVARLWAIETGDLLRLAWQQPLLELAIAISLALIGPGAYSVDARLYGRREIKIPPRPSSGGNI